MTLDERITEIVKELARDVGEAHLSKIESSCYATLRAFMEQEPSAEMSAAGFCVSEAEHDPAGVYRAMMQAALKELK